MGPRLSVVGRILCARRIVSTQGGLVISYSIPRFGKSWRGTLLGWLAFLMIACLFVACADEKRDMGNGTHGSGGASGNAGGSSGSAGASEGGSSNSGGGGGTRASASGGGTVDGSPAGGAGAGGQAGFEEAEIGPDGGSLTSADGRLTLEIPEGALDEDTMIRIGPAEDTTGFYEDLAYELTPHGLQFNTPATLTVEFDELPSDGELFLARRHSEEQFEAWPTSSVDEMRHTVRALIDGFSTQGVAFEQFLRDLPVEVTVSQDGTSVEINRTSVSRSVERAVNRGFTVDDSEFTLNSNGRPEVYTDYLGGAESACEIDGVRHWPCGAMYWYRYVGSKYVVRVPYFAPPKAIQDFEVTPDDLGRVVAHWAEGDAADGDAVLERWDGSQWVLVARVVWPDHQATEVGVPVGSHQYRLYRETPSGDRSPPVYASVQVTAAVETCNILVQSEDNPYAAAEGSTHLTNSHLTLRPNSTCLTDVAAPSYEWSRTTGESGGGQEELLGTDYSLYWVINARFDVTLRVYDGGQLVQTVRATLMPMAGPFVSTLQLDETQVPADGSVTATVYDFSLYPIRDSYPSEVGSIQFELWSGTADSTTGAWKPDSALAQKTATTGSSATFALADLSPPLVPNITYRIFAWVRGTGGDIISIPVARPFLISGS